MTSGTQAPVLIFGGVGGIGEALARRLRTAGQSVAITSRSAERVQALAAEIGATALVCDVLDEASIAAAYSSAAIDGHLNGLVYAVGSIPLKPLTRTTAEDMIAAYQVNVVGAMALTRTDGASSAARLKVRPSTAPFAAPIAT